MARTTVNKANLKTASEQTGEVVTDDIVTEKVVEGVSVPVTEKKETKVTKAPAKAVRKFEPDDLIECRSITAGTLLMIGKKTQVQYKWSGINDVIYVEYQDMLSEMISNSSYIFNPRIVVEDEELLADPRWKRVAEVYEKMYGKEDFDELLNLSNAKFKQVLRQLPKGLLESVKTEISSRIEKGTFDSLQKVKAVDEICGTDLRRMLD